MRYADRVLAHLQVVRQSLRQARASAGMAGAGAAHVVPGKRGVSKGHGHGHGHGSVGGG